MLFPKNYLRPKVSACKKNGKSISAKKPENENKISMNIKNEIPLLPKYKEVKVTRKEVRENRKKQGDFLHLKKRSHDKKSSEKG